MRNLLAVYHYQLQAIIIEINGLDCVDKDDRMENY